MCSYIKNLKESNDLFVKKFFKGTFKNGLTKKFFEKLSRMV
jgi:hypothetical protein